MNNLARQETIAAISTPPGAGGIGIIRISGSQALPLLKSIFQPKKTSCCFCSHQLYYGHIRQSVDGKILDEVLAVYMAAPHTYTREDVVEIHCHGSFLVLQNVLELILDSGAVLAEPGEFTKRAFLNGRIDLTRAEAVIDVLSAKTRKGVDLAQEQLSGALYNKIDPIRQSLVRMRAVIEVAIDFPDEEVEIIDHSALLDQLESEVTQPLTNLLQSADRGRLYREGISLVIAGLPNVGKSSLLNTILQEERALVTAVPGTTRDSIEEIVDIYGMPVRIIDTAGIRDDAGEVEELGIQRARDLINKADLILFMIDGSRELTDADRKLYAQVKHKPLLPVLNKIDLCDGGLPDLACLADLGRCVKISAREQIGIDQLKQAIFALMTSGNEQWEEGGCAPNVRHKQALAKAVEAAARIRFACETGLTNDLIAIDLQECLDFLAEIVGETTTEDILDVIFTQFCLGK
ncbi:tRNA uridine-5-carboxymethylaminomethyl(34) synthesis GTPase MnmE [Desulfopila sp. IMCC35006]|uniref:tRNA uridine-5-carboxymethylaminomethyl(34) synthesis GTPase MnmE n=1 Tax=Desulfopila sp. IMCC35006 TaxID=2569542 RepID=UPI0010AD9949|nr:tRNA uridine-5-carboxymethylaminomethyl(34) synthesis GTPase MnmE [Desulfopila sp. IMCC35006]TKB24937.1 tRNA uridine-5-carboxymethylaminomethyl(34) synthesis GTPase MnmE [Desulfopila sp. IMCC35006]